MARLWLAESKYVIELLKGGHGMEEERPERGCRRPTAAGRSGSSEIERYDGKKYMRP